MVNFCKLVVILLAGEQNVTPSYFISSLGSDLSPVKCLVHCSSLMPGFHINAFMFLFIILSLSISFFANLRFFYFVSLTLFLILIYLSTYCYCIVYNFEEIIPCCARLIFCCAEDTLSRFGTLHLPQ